MESITHSLQALTEHFNSQMAEFQRNLNTSILATSPTSHLAAQFSAFRSFVLAALEGLQQQVQVLSKQQDIFEMRSRRKVLLIHGVPEDRKEELLPSILKITSNHLKMPDISTEDISRCHRLGNLVSDKPRAILVKFKHLSLRSKVWFAKSQLKNTGITLSEFLTKPRHEVFVAARQRLGISKCWTQDGSVIVVGPDGKRHKVTTAAALNGVFNISEHRDTTGTPAPPGIVVQKEKQSQSAKDGGPVICNSCNAAIQGRIVTALDKKWHPEHFMCNTCHKPIDGAKFHQHDGGVHCVICYAKYHSPRCHGCGDPITDRVIQALGVSWHAHHFVCGGCKKELGGGGFMEQAGRPYCGSCYADKFAARCAGCCSPIVDKAIIALDAKWHRDCFTCTKCRNPVTDSTFSVLDNKPLCGKCA